MYAAVIGGIGVRPSVNYVRKRMKDRPLNVAEIGVAYGHNALNIFKTLNVVMLYAIDPYVPYIEHGSLWDTSNGKSIAAKKLDQFKDRVRFIYQSSEAAAAIVPDGLDFVYIDGNHEYEQCLNDIHLYYPKVAADGVIAGHDFGNVSPGVISAATRFSVEHNIQLMVQQPDWWFDKTMLETVLPPHQEIHTQ